MKKLDSKSNDTRTPFRGQGVHKISWLNIPGYIPETWNPIIGCNHVSPGCDRCYAERMANRLASNPKTKGNYSHVIANGKWNGLTTVCYDQVDKPLVWKKPRAIFVCSMGDLFHESVSFFDINCVFGAMSDCDQHIYIIITKRPDRMAEFFEWKKKQCMGVTWCPKPNVWLGVTAENQEMANHRIPILLKIPTTNRFVSIEPMLGAIDLTKIPAKFWGDQYDDLYNGISLSALIGGSETNSPWHLNWVIVGGETGPGARPMHPDWVRSIRDQCAAAKVPFFFKQAGTSKENAKYDWGNGEVNISLEQAYDMLVHGGGCYIDSKIHHEFPKI
ncbi:MAG: phage Gp37/Gp68 family protein [Bacteroidales bacterium]|jgi:protein gp37